MVSLNQSHRLPFVVFLGVAFATSHLIALDWGYESNGGIDTYNADRHNPFNNNPAFVAKGLDLSGVGVFHKPADNTDWWVTMISDRYFLTSAHIDATNGGTTQHTVNFFHDFTGSAPETASIDKDFGERIGGSDLWLGRLTSTPSPAVKRYPLIKRQEATYYPSYVDPEIYLVGYRNGENGASQTRVGLNDIVNVYGAEEPLLAGDIGNSYQNGVSKYNGDAATNVGGDSSGPTFVANGYGGIALAGIHYVSGLGVGFDTSISAHISDLASISGVSIVTDLLGDFNGDYRVDSSDFDIWRRHYGMESGASYNDGDLNGDGRVDTADYTIFSRDYGKSGFAPSDFNQDQSVDKVDMLNIGNHWHTSVTAHTNGDANGDGYVDAHDVDVLDANWRYKRWTTSNPGIGDFNSDGVVDVTDYDAFSAESAAHNSCSAPSWCNGKDLNTDGTVNDADLLIFFNHWAPYSPADINEDGKVDNTDLKVLLDPVHWMQTIAGGKSVGDLDGNGVVNMDDFEIMTNWWGRGLTSGASQLSFALVPEASTAILACIGALCMSGDCRVRRF
jgi:hypothetical protein